MSKTKLTLTPRAAAKRLANAGYQVAKVHNTLALRCEDCDIVLLPWRPEGPRRWARIRTAHVIAPVAVAPGEQRQKAFGAAKRLREILPELSAVDVSGSPPPRAFRYEWTPEGWRIAEKSQRGRLP
jgi:hypothetical protein